nr:hypothetical protein BaRGS_006442 [Batillaria attramentaria]
MKLSQALATVVLVLLFTETAVARKGKKGKHLAQAPQWKSNSDPGKDERFFSENEGKSVRLDCRAKGKPSPKVMWFKDGQRLSKDDDNVDIKKYKLTLSSLAAENRGNYTCVVSNSEGRLEWTFYVDVVVRIWPLLVEGPQNMTATVGETVRFRCRVLNDPEATIRWLKPNPPGYVDGSGKPEFLENFGNPEVLELANVQPEDAGEYRCMAGNVWGLKYSSAFLTFDQPMTDLYETTRAPRNRKKNKNGRRRRPPKNRQTTTTTTTFAPSTTNNPFATIWNFNDIPGGETGITSNNVPDNTLDTEGDHEGSQGMGESTGVISLWTVYTIVGAVAGVILLIGLLAITIAVCCRRDGDAVYKSTPV